MEKANLIVIDGPVIKLSITGGPVIKVLLQQPPLLKFNIGKTLYIFDTSFANLTGRPQDNQSLINYINSIGSGGASLEELKKYIDSLIGGAVADTRTLLISGAIIWKSGLTYISTDIVYKILGRQYTAKAQEITLANSDPNLSRIDTFYVDTFGNLQVATGIPAVNPTSSVLTSNQLEVMTALLAPGALVPSNINVKKVYDELDPEEWIALGVHDNNVTVALNSTDSPVNGISRIKVGIAIPDTEISSPLHYIGEKYQGGRIFHLDASGKKGLISAENDTAINVFWSRLSGYSVYGTGATGQAIGTGQANTLLMLANAAAKDQAVKFCNELVYEGYDDWFLPSSDEVMTMYFRRQEIGNFQNKGYWSSSENAWNKAWWVSFGNGVPYPHLKNNSYCVRAIRAFDDTTLPTGQPVETFTPVNTKLTFTAPEPISAIDGVISLNIKSSLPWRPNSTLLIESFLGSDRMGSVAISPSANMFNYISDSNTWQMVILPLYNFAPSKSMLDGIKISLVGSWPNNIDLGIDDVRFQYSTMGIPEDVVSVMPGIYGSTTKHVSITVNSQGKVTDIKEIDVKPAEVLLLGDIDGINKVFSTSDPYEAGTLQVFVNGLKERHYTELSDTQVEFIVAPKNEGFTDLIEAIYIKKQL